MAVFQSVETKHVLSNENIYLKKHVLGQWLMQVSFMLTGTKHFALYCMHVFDAWLCTN